MQQSFRNCSEDHTNSRLAYITHEDLCSSFEGDTLLAIRAPPHTHLEVPIPEDDQVRLYLYFEQFIIFLLFPMKSVKYKIFLLVYVKIKKWKN